MKDLTSTEKILAVSASLILLGGLGVVLAYKRTVIRRKRAKNLSIQIV